MTRAHDMGGRFGDGPIDPGKDKPIFEKDWHARALAITLASGALGQWNIDVSRHARERLSPKDYAGFSYYEKWMAGLANLLVETDLVNIKEMSEVSSAQSPLNAQALKAENVGMVLAKGAPADRPSDVARRFNAGDAVKTRRIIGNRLKDGGHTRLPTYAAGACGHIIRYHGTHVLPDSSAHHLGEAAEPLYAVAFPASELWAQPEHPQDEVVLDLWQSYLEPIE
ncbi:MAG: nitrile hydratase subunit beta [Roseobacter sp.]